MKRPLMLLLIPFLLLMVLPSCKESQAVTFYYLRPESAYQSNSPSGVITGESREAAGSIHNLRDLLILYLHGPTNDNLRSPLPTTATLVDLEQASGTLTIRLESTLSTFKNTTLPLACACIAQTCFGLTDADTVTILFTDFPDTAVTMNRNSLLLVDDSGLDTDH